MNTTILCVKKMASLVDYFAKSAYKPTYEFMARVTGVYKGVRWIGSVGNDTLISPDEGPVLHIQLDLPLKINGEYKTILVTKHKGVKRLVSLDKL